MGGIPDQILQEIRDRADIVEVLGAYLSLKRAGSRFKGNCPFHADRSPSFFVQPDVGRFHCFGCQANGDVFEFLMRHQGLTFPEAVRDVASRLGIEIPESTGPTDPASRARRDRREELLDINERVCEFFEKCLWDPRFGEQGRTFLRSRGIPERVAREHRLGYAPRRWDALVKSLRRKEIPLEDAATLGLIGLSEARERRGARGDDRYYDRFRHRIILPVLGTGGRVVAFGSRVVSSDDPKAPKYMNSPESELYAKGRELYGLHPARKAIRTAKQAIVVEGNFDVLACWEAGIENVVAIMGTAMTPDQIRLLGRYARDVVLCFDGDSAGRAAVLKSAGPLLEAGMNARVITLPDSADPDDTLKGAGRGEKAGKLLRELAAAAPDLVEHAVRSTAESGDGSVPGRMKTLELAGGLLWRVADELKRELYVGRVAAILEESEDHVRRAMARAAGERLRGLSGGGTGSRKRSDGGDPWAHGPDDEGPPSAPAGEGSEPAIHVPKSEATLLAFLLRFPNLRAMTRDLGSPQVLSYGALRDLCEELCSTGGDAMRPVDGLDKLHGNARVAVNAALVDEFVGTADEAAASRYIQEVIARIRRDRAVQELEAISRDLQKAHQRGDLAAQHALQERIIELQAAVAQTTDQALSQRTSQNLSQGSENV